MKTAKFLEKIQKKISPAEKSLEAEAENTINEINLALKKKRISATAVEGGSVAKGTYLKGDHDVDIFVKFNLSYDGKDLSAILEKTLKSVKNIKVERVHGSRDYFQTKTGKGPHYEIVPVLDIKNASEARNVTDMSPMHVAWVRKFISKKTALEGEIRLTKQFCKAQGIYGAESYVKGFSGHVIDIMIIHYKSFENMIKAASRWKEREILDFYNYYKGNALTKLNKAKIISPLIVIDPIMPERNAAAALSKKSFEKMIKQASLFLKKPSESFFKKKSITLAGLKKKAGKRKLIILNAEPLKAKADVAGSKLLKAHEHIIGKLKKSGFNLVESGWQWNKEEPALFWYVLKDEVLEKKQINEGPPIKSEAHVTNFKKKHKKTFVKAGKIHAIEKREFIKAEILVKHILKNEKYVLEKVKKIKQIKIKR